MYKKLFFVTFAAVFCILLTSWSDVVLAKSVTIVLKNGKIITGDLIEDVADYLLIINDLGEIKIRRGDIEKVTYDAFMKIDEENVENGEPLNDRVVVHLRDDGVVDGFLLVKSPSMIMVQTELGRLTIPKQDVRLVEYVSEKYAEQGEAVRIVLVSGAKFEGYLYHEDRKTLTLNTSMGRLNIDKENLRSIEYNVGVKLPRPDKKKEAYLATKVAGLPTESPLRKRQDTFELGYAPQFGEDYSTGGSFMYRNRYLVKSFPSFSLNLEGKLGLAAFSLNKDVIAGAAVPGAVTASGAAVISTLGVAAPIHLYPNEGSSYVFFLTPMVESHFVYTSLKTKYPSFPSLDTEARSTEFRFGLGSQIGMEWAFGENWKAGLSFNMHFLLNENDYSTFALHVGTKLF